MNTCPSSSTSSPSRATETTTPATTSVSHLLFFQAALFCPLGVGVCVCVCVVFLFFFLFRLFNGPKRSVSIARVVALMKTKTSSAGVVVDGSMTPGWWSFHHHVIDIVGMPRSKADGVDKRMISSSFFFSFRKLSIDTAGDRTSGSHR